MKHFKRKLLLGVLCSIFIFAFVGIFFFNSFQHTEVMKSFSESTVDINPYGDAPLSAILNINISQKGYFKVKIGGKGNKGVPIVYTAKYSEKKGSLNILGLYADYKNEVEVSFFNEKGKKIGENKYYIKTPPFYREINLELIKNTLGNTYRGLYGFTNTTTLFDQNGDIRWYLNHDKFSAIFTHLKNGNFLVSSNKESVRYQHKYFYEVSPLGEIIKKYTVPNRYHHEILELKNGNFLTTGNLQNFNTLADPVYREDTIIEIDRESGKIVNTLDLYSIFPDIRPKNLQEFPVNLTKNIQLKSNTGDWIHINSLYVDQNNNVIVSMRNIDMIASINRDTKKLNWVLSHRAKNYASTKDYALKFSKDNKKDKFEYPLVQHSAILDKEGNLYVFDNGTGRANYLSQGQEGEFSRVLKYKIFKDKKEVELIWEYIHPKKLYTPFTGSINILDNKSYLIGYTVNSDGPIHLVQVDDQGNIELEIEKSGRTDYRAIRVDITK